ncbi:MAG: SRPBCC family protein [Thermoleophilaceae bacterium]|nr:SRPBCC family protein [Thermoleophilaceae bacterium]
MREVTVDTYISASREAIFDFVADLAARPAYTDHYLDDFRLARVNAVGPGAAARFRLKVPMGTQYCELSIREADRPRRIVEELRVGRRGRNRCVAVYDFSQEGPGLTRVELTTYSEPATVVDRFKEVGAARWVRRRTKKALQRLRSIFEEPPEQPPKRVTIAGYEAAKAARFGAHTGMDPSHAPRQGS